MSNKKRCIGVLTSGGDAPGMNAAVRAVVRTALQKEKEGVKIYAIYEGYKGMIEGGDDNIRLMDWDSVGGIMSDGGIISQGGTMSQGGTLIGSARCSDFKERAGQQKAVENLLKYGIDRLIVIGGDGSLSGAAEFHKNWPELLKEIEIDQGMAKLYPHLYVVGLASSIDNDMFGTDMTIGTDSALHRINEAVDAISSTAASHNRIFVVKVMGRNCGCLALLSSLITGADWFFIPEKPPKMDTWKIKMCNSIKEGRQAGRKATIVILAEGAKDRGGNKITEEDVKEALVNGIGADVRTMVLGHLQRGGTPSAFDRNMSTRLGHEAVNKILSFNGTEEPILLGMNGYKIESSRLEDCIKKSRDIDQKVEEKRYDEAMNDRGQFFLGALETIRILKAPNPPIITDGNARRFRFAVLHSGTATPGMNTALRAAVRLGIAQGHTMLGVEGGFKGLIKKRVKELDWMSVNNLAQKGGSFLGASHKVPALSEFVEIDKAIRKFKIQGLVIIGGWSGYQATLQLIGKREIFKSFKIPIICMPATINNNLPGTDASVGADTALNNIMEALDKIKQSAGEQSAGASRRCFLMEVGGNYCGYLALLSGLAAGVERVYLHEKGIRLKNLIADLKRLKQTPSNKARPLTLMIRNEKAYDLYDTSFIRALFKMESDNLFDVDSTILGQQQYEGNPSPFDRILATRFADECIKFLVEKADQGSPDCAFVGVKDCKMVITGITVPNDFTKLVNEIYQRPKEQWWMDLVDVFNDTSLAP